VSSIRAQRPRNRRDVLPSIHMRTGSRFVQLTAFDDALQAGLQR